MKKAKKEFSKDTVCLIEVFLLSLVESLSNKQNANTVVNKKLFLFLNYFGLLFIIIH